MNFGASSLTHLTPPGGAIPAPVGKSLDYLRAWNSGRDMDAPAATALSRPAEQSAWVFAALGLIVEQINAVPLRWKDSDEAPDFLPEDPDRARFWQSPAAARGMALAREDVVSLCGGWLKMRGIVHLVLGEEWLAARRNDRPPFLIARHDAMKPVERDGMIIGWRVRTKAGEDTLLPEQVVTLRFASLYDDLGGASAYAAAKTAAEADAASGRHALHVAASNGSMGEYITTDGAMLTAEQITVIEAQLAEKRRRVRNGDFAVTFLAGGLKVEDPKIRSVDAAFTSARVQNREEIYAALGIPLSFAAAKSSYSLGADSDMRQLVFATCIPLARKIAHAFSRIETLRAGVQRVACFDWRDHPTTEAATLAKFASIAPLADRGVPMRDINELLRLGLPRFTGDDVGFVPFGVQPVADSLAPAEPEPAPAIEPGETLSASLRALLEMRRAKAIEISAVTGGIHPAKDAAGSGSETPENVLPASGARAGGGDAAGSSATAALRPALRIISPPPIADSAPTPGVTRGGEPDERPTPNAQRSTSNDKSRARLWNSHQAKRAPFERRLKSALVKVFGRARAEVLAKLAKLAPADEGRALDAAMPLKTIVKAGGFEFELDADALGDALWKAAKPALTLAMEKAGAELIAEVGRDDAFKLAPKAAKAFLDVRENKIRDAAADVFDGITATLKEGFDAGETMAELAGRVKTEFAGISDRRATTIAATETGTAYNAARSMAMSDIGATHKEWLSARDGNVRDEHAAMDGTVIPVDEDFEMPDGARLAMPCDPNGPPQHVINCRCTAIVALIGLIEPELE